MKKILLALFSLCTAFAYSQSVPNAGFEFWNSATYDYPQSFPFTSNSESYYKCGSAFSSFNSPDAYHGIAAVQLSTSINGNDTCFGYIINTNASNGNPSTWSGGFPYTQTPTGMRGWYKSAIPVGDSAGIIAIFRNSGSMIGMYMYKFSGTQSTYTNFAFSFVPPLPIAPDSVIIAVVSSDVFNNVAMNGSTITLDSVSFTGAAQPAAFDGDFETWASQTLYKPFSWATGDSRGNGFARSSDAHNGFFAMELQTYAGENNGIPRAQAGQVSIGYWDNSCSCWMGGYPFSTQTDTFAFYYKYSPSGNDTAQVYLMFKNNGSMVWSTGMNISAAASSYQYAELPFNVGTAIDSVIIQFQSSSWSDTALTFIGSNFKIDDVGFKSEGVGIHDFSLSGNSRSFAFPNPVHDVLNIRLANINNEPLRFTLYDVTGRMLMEENINSTSAVHRMNVSQLSKGVYVYELTGTKTRERGRFVKE